LQPIEITDNEEDSPLRPSSAKRVAATQLRPPLLLAEEIYEAFAIHRGDVSDADAMHKLDGESVSKD
jgi:hypothetical protein